jgi:hypothetical protein
LRVIHSASGGLNDGRISMFVFNAVTDERLDNVSIGRDVRTV